MKKVRSSVVFLLFAAVGLFFLLAWVENTNANPLEDPILLITNSAYPSNPYGSFLGEILKAEGLNSYKEIDLSAVTAEELNLHDVVILAETSLSSAQAQLFTNFVNARGRLVAMRPDPQIAGLFGLDVASGSLVNGYLKINLATAWNGELPGSGLTPSALQIHGAASQYTPKVGAVVLAELYSNRTTPAGYPAVIGSSSGQAVAFTYDLARNVIYTRQGNPANGDVDVDGDGVFRTIDLFQTSGGGAPWVDREVIPVPQADEQQRFFARLVRQLVNSAKPLPQLWYFPGTTKTMLILTADAHNNPTSWYQDEIDVLNALNARMTFYLTSMYGLEPSDADVQAWRAQGHEFGIHPWAYKPDPFPPFDIQTLVDGYRVFDYFWGTTYSSPKSRTVRNHQVAWLGWTDAAELAVSYNINLDTDFYHWGQWLQKADLSWPHGYITGSGQPMKFVRSDGAIINNYQLLTELVDEQLVQGAGLTPYEQLTPAQATLVSQELIDASQAGNYAALMTQFHVDYFTATRDWVIGTLSYANSLGIPIWNADQFLTFTEARANTRYTDIAWDNGLKKLTFSLQTPTKPETLTTLIPVYYSGLGLVSVYVDGANTAYVVQNVKGVPFAFVSTSAANHTFVANYAPGVPAFNLVHTTYNDFMPVCASLQDTYVSDLNQGSVILAGQLADGFSGSTLNPGLWTLESWSGQPYTPQVANGYLTMPGGGYVRSQLAFTRGVMDVTAQFGNGAWQHIGFAADGLPVEQLILFSTLNGDGNLYARANNGSTPEPTPVSLGPLPTGFHRYRIEWVAVDATTDRAIFYVDGVFKTQLDFPSAGAANYYLYLSNNGTADLVVDYAQVAPAYRTSGTYTSCILDAGVGFLWQVISWDAVGSSVLVQTNTSPNGVDSWSGWTTVPTSGTSIPKPDRFIQYRLLLSTSDVATTPVVNSVTLAYGKALADLSLTKAVNNSTPDIGSNVTFTLTITNSGVHQATGIKVKDFLPDGYTYVSATPSQGTFNSGTAIWDVGALAMNESATLQLTAQVRLTGGYTNIAEVWASDALDPDSSPGNGLTGEDDYATVTTNPVPVADLSIAKVGFDTATAGTTLNYSLAVTNHGPSVSANVLVTDAVPTGVTITGVTTLDWTCNFTSNTVTCNRASLNQGTAQAIVVTANISASLSGNILSSSRVSSSGTPDRIEGNNLATVTTQIVRQADFSIQKTGPDTALADGTTLQSYTLTVTNAGPSYATSVTVTDTVPLGMSLVSASGTGWDCSQAGRTATCSRGEVTVGATPPSISVSAVVLPSAKGSLVNNSRVSSAEDPVSANNTASKSTLVTRSADLALVKSGGATAIAGETVSYELAVTNGGPSYASSVVVTDTLPVGMTFQSVTGSGWDCSTAGQTATCSSTDVPTGSAPSITVVANVGASQKGSLVNNSRLTSSEDPNPANNSSSATTNISRRADLSMIKSGGATAIAGQTVSYNLAVTNGGPSYATSVTVTDTLPTGFSFSSVSGSGWNCSTQGLTATCTRSEAAVGSAPLIQVEANVPTSALGTYTNRSRVSSSEDLNPGNDTSNANTEVSWRADLALEKAGGATATAGEVVTYTLTVTNNGPSNSAAIVINDTLPAGLTYYSSNMGWACSIYPLNQVHCAGGDLAFGATKSLVLVASINPNLRGSLTNQAVVASDSEDLVLGNNESSTQTNVVGVADLAVAKVVSDNAPEVFSTVVFTVTVTNNGPSQATGVVISDTLPAGYTEIVTDPKQGSYADGVWTVGTLNLHASAQLVVSAKVLPQGAHNNTAQVAQLNETDPKAQNDSITLSVTPVLVDLSLTQSVLSDKPGVGTTIVIRLKVLNSGPNSTGGVKVQNVLPAGLTFVSATAGYDELTGVWTVGTLQVGQEAVLELTVRVEQVGLMTHVAQIIASDRYDPDSTPGNDVTSEDDYSTLDLTGAYYIYLPIVARAAP